MAACEKMVLDANELAAALGICRPRAYELLHQKGFPSIRITERRYVVPKTALEAWLLQQAQGEKEAK